MRVRTAVVVALLAASLVLPASAYAFDYPSAEPPGRRRLRPRQRPQLKRPPRPPPRPSNRSRTPSGSPRPRTSLPGSTPQGVFTTPLPPGAKTATSTYNLDWTIGDCRQVRLPGLPRGPEPRPHRRTDRSPVSTSTARSSRRRLTPQTLCTDCHVDFAYKTPHPTTVAERRVEDHRQERVQELPPPPVPRVGQQRALDCGQSQPDRHRGRDHHGRRARLLGPGQAASALRRLPRRSRDSQQDRHGRGRGDSRFRARDVRPVPHCERATTYVDYYHGAAYRRGAEDAPACWQCHNTHLILPSANRLSWTNEDNLADHVRAVPQGHAERPVHRTIRS